MKWYAQPLLGWSVKVNIFVIAVPRWWQKILTDIYYQSLILSQHEQKYVYVTVEINLREFISYMFHMNFILDINICKKYVHVEVEINLREFISYMFHMNSILDINICQSRDKSTRIYIIYGSYEFYLGHNYMSKICSCQSRDKST